MLALRIHVPATDSTVDLAVADHVPVAELIPHLADHTTTVTPGQHWELRRLTGPIRPEHTLADAGVVPGECLTLDVARPHPAPTSALAELTQALPRHHAGLIAAVLAAFATWRSTPIFHPLIIHPPHTLWDSSHALAVFLLSALAALAAAAGSLYDRRLCIVAAILGFGTGLHLNVACAAVCAALLVWRSGPTRIVTIVIATAALLNLWPGLTVLAALAALTYSGQIALAIARIPLPSIPVNGEFRPIPESRAGTAISDHSALVGALCLVIAVGITQLAPWDPPTRPSWAVIATLVCVAVTGVSARGFRPIHATALAMLSAWTVLWLGWQCDRPWMGVALATPLLAVPVLRLRSPMFGRALDWMEMLAFTLAVPCAVATTGVFTILRGLG